MDILACVERVVQVREDLGAHGAGLEGAAWLGVFEL